MAKYKNYSSSAKKTKRFSKWQIIVAILLGLVLLCGALFALDRKDIINLPFLPDNETPVQTPPGGINYDPPTKQEKTETEQFKDALGDKTKEGTSSAPAPTTSSGKKSVTPIMTSWVASPNVEVRGYVPGVNEDGGTCTVTLTKDGQKVTEAKTGISDVTTVSCGLITIARPRLSAGKWTATLSYTSNTAEGTSTSNSIEVE